MRVSKGAKARANRSYHPRHDVAAHYSIHDRAHVNALLKVHAAVMAAHLEKIKSPVRPPSLSEHIVLATNRYLKAYGMLGKYSPHQGRREMERRRIGGFHKLHQNQYCEV